jgi:GrpB-like predicted nucleotidyltransferase (UPF0157 family)
MTHPIVIVPYNARWPEEFAGIGAELRAALGDLALRIDHIGSTAVPGLSAKDVIDIQITVASLDPDPIAAALARAGFTLRADVNGDHVPPGAIANPDEWRKLYAQPHAGHRRVHVHVRQAGRANGRYALLFRDYLRANAAVAAAYLQVKEALARLHPDDPDAYYDVKDPVCDLIIDGAERWARAMGYLPGPSDQ